MMCGDSWRNSVYSTSGSVQTTSSPQITTSTTSAATVLPPATEDGYIGCYIDSRDRAMEIYAFRDASTAQCLEYCADNGYPYAGMQYGQHCFCGFSFDKYGEDPDGCNDQCSYSPDESDMTCGDTWRNSVYATGA